jgi:hypothetical protein
LERFTALLDAYGAIPARWPSGERDAALALLAGSPEARARRAAAAQLDGLLDRVPAPALPSSVRQRSVAGLPGAPRSRPSRPWRVAALALTLAAAAVLVWQLSGVRAPEVTSQAIADLGVYATPTDVLLNPPGIDLSGAAPAVGCGESGWGCPFSDVPAAAPPPARPGPA